MNRAPDKNPFGYLETNAHLRALLSMRDDELAKARESIATLESLRPHWAQGWTSDSIAAAVSTAALSQLWKLLGVSTQTEAVIALQDMIRRNTTQTDKNDSPTYRHAIRWVPFK